MTIATKSLSNEIFIVHGHDETAKSQVALLIERAGLKPIILHEQGNGGKTIIEKFEKYGSAVGFAVVIASPDDVGGLAVSPPGEPDLKPRARQNVVGEMFWFAGRLGRDKVCALVKGNIDMPSDFCGCCLHSNGRPWRLEEQTAAGANCCWVQKPRLAGGIGLSGWIIKIILPVSERL